LKILKTFTLVFIIVLILAGFQTLKSSEPVRKELLGNHNDSEVYLFTMTNKSGNVLKVTNYGAKIVRIEIPDKNGLKDNVTLGSETLESILKGDMFGGGIPGNNSNQEPFIGFL
jgi:aldose 1-epimerase